MGSVIDDVDDETVLARAYLSRVGEPANIPLWMLVNSVGPVEVVNMIRSGNVPDSVSEATIARRDTADPEADLLAAERQGIDFVVPESARWPHFGLRAFDPVAAARATEFMGGKKAHLESGEPIPPLALWTRGSGLQLNALGVRSVGVVGARASTAYGEHVTAELAYGLARAGVAVVSGGAYGIDAAAHRAALAANGPTVLVSAGGLDRPYPAANASLYDKIAATGLLVSESPPGCAPFRSRFLTRNRIIAGLSSAVLVVEAAQRSGALNTARHARDLGRPVLAVPGPITSGLSAGCHGLLRGDPPALLVTRVEEVLAEIGDLGADLAVDAQARRDDPARTTDARAELDRLDPTSRRVFEGLPAVRYVRPEQLATRSGVGVLEVIRTLPTLDLAGLLEESEGGYRIAQRLRPPKPVDEATT